MGAPSGLTVQWVSLESPRRRGVTFWFRPESNQRYGSRGPPLRIPVVLVRCWVLVLLGSALGRAVSFLPCALGLKDSFYEERRHHMRTARPAAGGGHLRRLVFGGRPDSMKHSRFSIVPNRKGIGKEIQRMSWVRSIKMSLSPKVARKAGQRPSQRRPQ